MPRLNYLKVLLTLLPLIFCLLWLGNRTDSDKKIIGEGSPASRLEQGSSDAQDSSHNELLLDPNHQIVFPLAFPIKGISHEIIKEIPDSRLPGAKRLYRGANSEHLGLDLYTGKCGLDVISPASGWIIAIRSAEEFPDNQTRDAILTITERAGFTIEPVLSNLHGISLVIFHGWDENGRGYYSRLSHLERLATSFKVGDFVNKGEKLGYVGATGTSAQFKSIDARQSECHLHFEWHIIQNRKDTVLGINEPDVKKRRGLYLQLFSNSD